MHPTRRIVLAGLALSGCAGAAPGMRLAGFTAADGTPVSGRFYGEGRHGVVLVPGGHGVGETWDLQARRLAQAGLRVLAIDYRGRGGGGGAPDDEKVPLDVLGAVRRLKADGAERVSVVGASWGGWAAATAAVAEPGAIDRLVLLAHSPFEAPERLTARTLFILAEGDRDGRGRSRLDAIRAQFDSAPEPKKLVTVDGAAHAQFLFLTPQGERAYREIERFLTD